MENVSFFVCLFFSYIRKHCHRKHKNAVKRNRKSQFGGWVSVRQVRQRNGDTYVGSESVSEIAWLNRMVGYRRLACMPHTQKHWYYCIPRYPIKKKASCYCLFLFQFLSLISSFLFPCSLLVLSTRTVQASATTTTKITLQMTSYCIKNDYERCSNNNEKCIINNLNDRNELANSYKWKKRTD